MRGVARNFFTLAIVYAICGMALGLSMSMTHDHSQMPVHAHAMVAGWLMSAVFAFFYHLVPAAGLSRLASTHFYLQAISGIVLLVGLFFLLDGHAGAEPVVASASLVFYAGMLLFAYIAITAMYRRSSAAPDAYPEGTPAAGLLRNSAAG